MITDLANLRRVTTDRGSHIEPPLDQDWSDLDKLRWNARVVEVDNDLPAWTISIHERDGRFSIGTSGTGRSDADFHTTWRDLVSMGTGLRLALTIRDHTP